MVQEGTNSFVSLDKANSYFAQRLDVSAWVSATDEDKEKALITATMRLNDLPWVGYAETLDGLAFPRKGSYRDPKTGQIVDLSSGIPYRISLATMELAHHLLENDGVLDSGTTMDLLKVGPITIQNMHAAPQWPLSIVDSLKPLLQGGSIRGAGAGMWWRNN